LACARLVRSGAGRAGRLLARNNAYQINADDVYGQAGFKGIWDLKIGRFRTWRVYHKGAGFDL